MPAKRTLQKNTAAGLRYETPSAYFRCVHAIPYWAYHYTIRIATNTTSITLIPINGTIRPPKP